MDAPHLRALPGDADHVDLDPRSGAKLLFVGLKELDADDLVLRNRFERDDDGFVLVVAAQLQ
jgi:hypothetical protein